MAWIYGEADHAKLYSRFRPAYPKAVYDNIITYMRGDCKHDSGARWSVAIDVGCGNGLSTVPLSEYFDRVVGVDQSQVQLDTATAALDSLCEDTKSRILYRCGIAHDLSFQQDSSVDLITAAAALHWFDIGKFYSECLRVLRPGGVLAAYSYCFPTAQNPAAREILTKFITEKLKLWEIEVWRHPITHYNELYEGFKAVFSACKRLDSMSIDRTVAVDELIGYVHSLASYKNYVLKYPEEPDPLVDIRQQLMSICTKNGKLEPMSMCWPVFMLLGTKPQTCESRT